MMLHTLIARLDDVMPLAASTENSRQNIDDQKQQAKRIVKLLSESSPAEMSISAGHYYFIYIIKSGVAFLTLCENAYPKKLAMAFLNEIASEFHNLYSSQIESASRPYQFVSSINHFDHFIEQTKKLYVDTRSQQNLQRLQDDLHDVQGIMARNITEVLDRGTKLENLTQQSELLSYESKKYSDMTAKLKFMAMMRKMIPVTVVCSIVSLLMYFYIL